MLSLSVIITHISPLSYGFHKVTGTGCLIRSRASHLFYQLTMSFHPDMLSPVIYMGL